MPDSTDLKVVGEQLPFPWGGVSASRGAPGGGLVSITCSAAKPER